MSEDKDDKAGRILRGNIDHDPKPDFAKRGDAKPRGVGGPALTFGGMAPAASFRRPEQRTASQARNEPGAIPGAPTAERNDSGKPRGFRRFGDLDPKTIGEEKQPGSAATPEQEFRRFGAGELSREFNGKSGRSR